MFSFLRLLICLIIAWIAFRFIKPISPKGRKIKIIGYVISVALASTMLTLVPIENSIYTFKSPEAAYKYFDYRCEVQFVVEGDECDFVIAKEGSYTTIYDIIPKTEDGWNVPVNFDTEVADYKSGDVNLTLWRYKPTDEYFIYVRVPDPSTKVTISDCYGSTFYSFENNRKFDYYAAIKDFDSQYVLTVDGTEYKFNK